jgi:hypothetical protein
VSYEILPIHLAVKAMRDSGYKNAAYAIAELIDNSIQAGATRVALLCAEVERRVDVRVRRQIDKIAILDNGSGMDGDMLRAALQFGNGQYLGDRSGIGRFGMGLPNSSLSQAKRVDVWSWKSGGRPLHSHLDLSAIVAGRMREVPVPAIQAIPDEWKRAAGTWPRSGTLVVWSDLDRCQWRTARAIIDNSEDTIGRVYRRFIADGRVSIRMASFVAAEPTAFDIDRSALPNDPLYLTGGTSCPSPWDREAMFEPWGGGTKFTVALDGREHDVVVRFSIAKSNAREGHNPGERPYGRHAAGNVGVSVVRADRELELQLGWTSRHDPRERWWGCEVEIPTGLDEVFGVTNDKQCARALADISMLDLDQIYTREGFSTFQELKDAWAQERDPRLVLLQLKSHIETNLSDIRKKIAAQTARASRRESRHDPNSAEARGTEATRKRQLEGHRGTSDADETKPADERSEDVKQAMVAAGVEETEAQRRAVAVIRDGRKYEFVHVEMQTDAFFSVRPKGGTILIQLNTDHSAYKHLVALLEQDPDDSDVVRLRDRMRKSHEGLKLLLEAWARYEDELSESQKDRARDARSDWGRVAREFLRED